MCTRPFEQNIWFSFIYFFFCVRPFDEDLESSLIYFFDLHTTNRQKYVVLLLILSFVYDHPTKIKVLIDLFFLFVHDHSAKLYGPLPSCFSFSCVTKKSKFCYCSIGRAITASFVRHFNENQENAICDKELYNSNHSSKRSNGSIFVFE